MSSAVLVVDSLIKEYLIFRGFTSTLKQLEVDLKNEKERGFKVFNKFSNFIWYFST